MLTRIQKILSEQKSIQGYKIFEVKTESNELFFIKKNVDMDRAKNVHRYIVTVYKDFEEGGITYKGASSTNLHPTMDDAEIVIAIEEAAFAAQFVKNPYYPLVKPADAYQNCKESNFAKESLPYWMNEISKAVYKYDTYDKGGINSCEIFLEKIQARIINSEGVDVTCLYYKCMVEFITTWKEVGEEIELYRCIDCSEFDAELLSEEVKDMIITCKEKAIAIGTPKLESYPVILTRGAVRDIFSYYFSKGNAGSVYNHMSTWQLGEHLQGDEIEGDRITVCLNPFLPNSVMSRGFDEDGFALEPITMIKEGELIQYAADTRYAYYLKVPPTGNIHNLVVSGGNHTYEELKQEPHLEAIAFSDFSVDHMTGDFCGEIRLAYYYDGIKTVPVTGGSISGNIEELHHKLFLSKELQCENNFEGPKAIKLYDVTIAGVE